MEESQSRKWKFHRVGGFNQVCLESGEDLVGIEQLDYKLWAALSCPTKGLDFDEKTMVLVDADGDGRVRAPEVVAATQWVTAMIKNPDTLLEGLDSLPLDQIDDSTPEGKSLLESAKQILDYLGKSGESAISLEDASDTVKIFSDTLFNGDGVIPTDSADDAPTRGVIEEVMKCCGSEMDRGGKQGVNQAKVDTFFSEISAYSDWIAQSEEKGDEILPLAESTAEAFDTLAALKSKVDDFFTRCDLASYDVRALKALDVQELKYLDTAAEDLIVDDDEFARFPIAQANEAAELPLGVGVNPAWKVQVAGFVDRVVQPILGERESLSREDWETICQRLAAHEAWRNAKAGDKVESLGLERIRELMTSDEQKNISSLIQKDLDLADHANAIERVEKLLRLNKNLFTLLNNFVTLRDFYDPERLAIFQQGTLFLDGRSCELCVLVRDPKKHATLAPLSRCYLAYCDCTRSGSTDKMTIAAAFMNGASDFLMIGRNGVFVDRFGNDWDATITKVVENPISLREAFWSPYKRISKIVEDQFQKFAAAREKSLMDETQKGVGAIGSSMEKGEQAQTSAFDIARFAGVFAAIGLALGTLGAAFAAVMNGLLGLPMWQMPLVFLGTLLLVSGPPVLLAFMKLRQRNLAPLLDANGWAINARARINVPFGESLTRLAKLPLGARRMKRDPYQSKGSKRIWLVVVGLLIYIFLGKAFDNGWMHEWTRGLVGSEAAPVSEEVLDVEKVEAVD